MAALGIYPILWALRYMFYDYKGYGAAKFIGIQNFQRLLHDEQLWHAVTNTLIYGAGKVAITLPIALLLAVILNSKLQGRNVLRGIYFMPTILSTAVMSTVFYIIFNTYNGLLNQILKSVGLPSVEWLGTEHAMFTTILIAFWGGLGNYMLLFIAGLQGIPKDVYESASIDGANSYHKLVYITIPMLGPVLNIIMMIAIISALESYESIMVLTGGGPAGKTEVMYLYLFKLLFPVSTGESMTQEIGYGSAVAFVLALVVGAITGLYLWVSRKINNIY
ncbi:carbohydrate ABC transporter permease [Paenibacillus whitsoniae]|uniref:Sugar ABC transporter permease n=1 Tax=Paenibacillus whitsoniae TaxID=2496558 RepID=A0A430JK28_9BACL|nr:sugar ABC transporter permease [Paenibacillus whitsoniae]RTE11333.1 sugar ABC transporter permease [Paenibacillus whitsoniae]